VNPVWNETKTFRIESLRDDPILKVRVFDEDYFTADDDLGVVDEGEGGINLEQLLSGQHRRLRPSSGPAQQHSTQEQMEKELQALFFSKEPDERINMRLPRFPVQVRRHTDGQWWDATIVAKKREEYDVRWTLDGSNSYGYRKDEIRVVEAASVCSLVKKSDGSATCTTGLITLRGEGAGDKGARI